MNELNFIIPQDHHHDNNLTHFIKKAGFTELQLQRVLKLQGVSWIKHRPNPDLIYGLFKNFDQKAHTIGPETAIIELIALIQKNSSHAYEEHEIQKDLALVDGALYLQENRDNFDLYSSQIRTLGESLKELRINDIIDIEKELSLNIILKGFQEESHQIQFCLLFGIDLNILFKINGLPENFTSSYAVYSRFHNEYKLRGDDITNMIVYLSEGQAGKAKHIAINMNWTTIESQYIGLTFFRNDKEVVDTILSNILTNDLWAYSFNFSNWLLHNEFPMGTKHKYIMDPIIARPNHMYGLISNHSTISDDDPDMQRIELLWESVKYIWEAVNRRFLVDQYSGGRALLDLIFRPTHNHEISALLKLWGKEVNDYLNPFSIIYPNEEEGKILLQESIEIFFKHLSEDQELFSEAMNLIKENGISYIFHNETQLIITNSLTMFVLSDDKKVQERAPLLSPLLFQIEKSISPESEFLCLDAASIYIREYLKTDNPVDLDQKLLLLSDLNNSIDYDDNSRYDVESVWKWNLLLYASEVLECELNYDIISGNWNSDYVFIHDIRNVETIKKVIDKANNILLKLPSFTESIEVCVDRGIKKNVPLFPEELLYSTVVLLCTNRISIDKFSKKWLYQEPIIVFLYYVYQDKNTSDILREMLHLYFQIGYRDSRELLIFIKEVWTESEIISDIFAYIAKELPKDMQKTWNNLLDILIDISALSRNGDIKYTFGYKGFSLIPELLSDHIINFIQNLLISLDGDKGVEARWYLYEASLIQLALQEKSPNDTLKNIFPTLLDTCQKELNYLRHSVRNSENGSEYLSQESIHNVQASSSIISVYQNPWKALKSLLLAFRFSLQTCLPLNLESRLPKDDTQETGWDFLPRRIHFMLWYFASEKNGMELRLEWAKDILNKLKPRKIDRRKEPTLPPKHYSSPKEWWTSHIVEPHPGWRLAYIHALIDLGVNPGGKGQYILKKVAENDPSPPVREAAYEAYKRLSKMRDAVSEGSHRRYLMNAWWWFKQGHLMYLNMEIEEKEAHKIRDYQTRSLYCSN